MLKYVLENKIDGKMKVYKVKLLRDKTLIRDVTWPLDDILSIESLSVSSLLHNCIIFEIPIHRQKEYSSHSRVRRIHGYLKVLERLVYGSFL